MSWRAAALLACGAALAAAPALAQERRSTLELGVSHERLSAGFDDWRSVSLQADHRLREGRSQQAGLRRTERFGLRDSELVLAGSTPLALAGTAWIASAEASHSPSHRVRPSRTLFGQVQAVLPQGWLVGIGHRHSVYTQTSTDIWVPGVERYWGDWRAAYTVFAARIPGTSAGSGAGAGSGVAHRVQLERYSADGNSIGAGLTTGREVEYLGPASGALAMQVRNVSLRGHHGLAPDWSLGWELLAHDQVGVYRRYGVRLGVRNRV